MCEAYLLKPYGYRRESLALKRGPATQVTKAKRDIQLKQENCLPHSDVFRGCHDQPPRNTQVKRSKFCSLFLPLSLQGPSLSLLIMWLPCSNHYGSQDAMNVTLETGFLNVNSQSFCCHVSRQQGQMTTQRSGEFSGVYEHSPATTLEGQSSLCCPWQGDLKHTL